MINVLIADDEYFIRERLKKIIDWEGLGLNLIGEAENGKQVLEYLHTHTIDLLLLDIQMPLMTGLEVLSYIDEAALPVKTIILSGYNNFEYAQIAIKHHATSYLLKPIKAPALQETLLSCKQTILEEKERTLEVAQLSRVQNKQLLLDALSQPNFNTSLLLGKLPHLKDMNYLLCLSVFITEPLQLSQLQHLLDQETLSYEIFKEDESIYTLLIFAKQGHELDYGLTKLKVYHQSCIHPLFIGTSSITEIAKPWHPCYTQSLKALDERYFSTTANLLIYSEACSSEQTPFDWIHVRQDLTRYIHSQDAASCNQLIKQLFYDINQNHDITSLHLVMTEILLTLHITHPTALSLPQDINRFVASLIDQNYSLNELESLIHNWIGLCLNQSPALSNESMVANKLIALIHDHYQDSNLTIADLATKLEHNASYLSTVFKKATGISIIQYLTDYRLEKSKVLLLEQKHKISDVATLVGYSDIFYFSKRFKKQYGISPKEFAGRNNI
ncbi:MAG: response regulator transcription factor [Cellulosilyticaceae bacterium]